MLRLSFRCIVVGVGFIAFPSKLALAKQLVPQPGLSWTSDVAADESQLGSAIVARGGSAVVGGPTNFAEGSAWHLGTDGGIWTEQHLELGMPVGDGALVGTAVEMDGQGSFVVGAPGKGGHVFVLSNDVVNELEVGSGVKDQFGTSLALTTDLLLVGDQTSSSCMKGPCGAVFLFQWVNGWPQVGGPLFASTPLPSQKFGASVAAISGPPFRAIIGAPGDFHQDVPTGSIYLMQEDLMGDWALTKLIPDIVPGLTGGDKFGTQVAISDAWVLATTWDSGHVYAYDLAGQSWQLLDDLVPSQGLHRNVVLGPNFAAIGDFDGDGAVTFLSATGDGFSALETLSPPQSGLFGRFGRGLGLDGDVLWVGEPDMGKGRVHRYVLKASPGEICTEDGDCATGLCVREVCQDTTGGETGTGDGESSSGESSGGASTGVDAETRGTSTPTGGEGESFGTSSEAMTATSHSGDGGGVGYDYDGLVDGCNCSSRQAPAGWSLWLLGPLGLLGLRRRR